MGATSSSVDLDSIRGEKVDELPGRYLGSVPVKVAFGNDVAELAVERLVEISGKEHTVRVVVSTMGVYVIEKTSGDILKQVAIPNITFVAEHSRNSTVVMFFENDQSRRLLLCHAFKFQSKAALLALAINDAFAVGGTVIDDPDAGFLSTDVDSDSNFNNASQWQNDTSSSLKSSKATGLKALKFSEKELNRGKLLMEVENCLYHGSAPVSQPRGDHVIDEATPRICRIVKGKVQSPSRCRICIYERYLCVSSNSNDEIPDVDVKLSDLTFAKLTSNDTILRTIVHSSRLDTMNCYKFTIPKSPEGQPSIRDVIDGAQKKIHRAIQSKNNSFGMNSRGSMPVTASTESFAVIGNFAASFLDRVWVSGEGSTVAEDAVTTCLKHRSTTRAVFIQVSVEGVKVIDALNCERQEFVLGTVIFASAVCETFFVIITNKNSGKGMSSADVYKCAGSQAFDLANAIGEAFRLSVQIESENPFTPINAQVSVPKELLSAKQSSLHIKRSSLRAKSAIGAGQFGQVYLADFNRGNLITKKEQAAVKLLRKGFSTSDHEEFLREVSAMLDLDHPQVVKLIGVAVHEHPWLLILEYLQHGDLKSLLDSCRTNGIELLLIEQLSFCCQICSGMDYIASKRIIHMDLASRNVLIGTDNTCKIGDFGLSRRLPAGKDYWRPLTVIKISPKWSAIECLENQIFSIKSDVWACGITLWEVMSLGLSPYGDIKSNQVHRRVREGHRVSKPAKCPTRIHEIIQSCCESEPSNRPTFRTLHSELGLYQRNESHANIARDVGKLVHSVGDS